MEKVRLSPDADMAMARRWRNCVKNARVRCSESCYRGERIARKQKICWPIFGLIASPARMTGLQFWRNSAADAPCKAGWQRLQRIAGWIGSENRAVLSTPPWIGAEKRIISTA